MATRKAKKKCDHVLEAPTTLRFNNAIHERGTCTACGEYGEFVTKMVLGKEATEWVCLS